MTFSIDELLKQGEKARLIPTVAKSKHEERATSILLAMFRVVPDFAKAMLAEVGAPSNARASIECYTEVVFNSKNVASKQRPDGLIVVSHRNKAWTALIESKVGNTTLSPEQCESYLDIAKALNIDAVITISNQFSAVPNHHPVSVSKVKTRKVGFYHFSWLSLMSAAILLAENSSVEDPEQSFLLKEFIRYMRHESSGVTDFSNMGSSWRKVAEQVHQGAALRHADTDVREAVLIWHQLVRFLTLDLSIALGQQVRIALSRSHLKVPESRLKDDVEKLLRDKALDAEFDIPNAASRLSFVADFRRRAITLSMDIRTPQDKPRATTAINWLTRQIKEHEGKGLLVRVMWPRKVPDTQASLESALAEPAGLVPDDMKNAPKSIAVLQVLDLGVKFRTATGLIDTSRAAVPAFYKLVGEQVSPWVPPPPKIRKQDVEEGDEVGSERPDAGSESTDNNAVGEKRAMSQPSGAGGKLVADSPDD